MSLLVKRFFDITLAFGGLLVLSPLFLWIAILIKRDSAGPIFYLGRRIGKNGKPFNILKFRTMREEQESYAGPKITARDDQRITRVGKWLRDTKINELPQLWNVLVGEMSLVGPRPEDPDIVVKWSNEDREEILSILPGLTSPASVAYRDEENRLDGSNLMGNYMEKIAPDKMRLDRLYVRHRSVMTDLDVIFWTLVVLIPPISRQPDTEGLLFGGPFTRRIRPMIKWTVVDFFVAMISVGVSAMLWRSFGPLNIGMENFLLVTIAYSLFISVMNMVLGINQVEWSRASVEEAYLLLFSCGVVTAVSTLLDLFIMDISFPDGYIFTSSLIAGIGLVVVRYRLRIITGLAARWVRNRGYGPGERVLIIGAGAGGEMATWLLRRPDFRHLFRIVGYVDDAPITQGMRFDGIPVIGTTADIRALVGKEDVGLICFAINKISEADRMRIIGICRQTNSRVVILSDVINYIQEQFIPASNHSESNGGVA